MVRVFIDHEILPPDREFRILDGAQPVLAQEMERRTEGTYWALWVKDVPPLGLQDPAHRSHGYEARARTPPPKTPLASRTPSTSSPSIPARAPSRACVDKETGAELVDPDADVGLRPVRL